MADDVAVNTMRNHENANEVAVPISDRAKRASCPVMSAKRTMDGLVYAIDRTNVSSIPALD
eukprot:CAMPEP_0201693978 /NCGR_PEP_ID=MMETSP0578-20130828/6401_1 /ASSEMBLY_ACC=CAM_ASM_000663 /TAXON_ID=267565 /ORGANISM="Skeletonema grethea, Strain CCMP 1804" /LENGTH=60 /DNA_ID=CAMNT_0048179595 /DNA_START=127 /DNA_END=307 /DNA_ORIENTATION=+